MEHLLLKSLYEQRAKIHAQMADTLREAREKGTDVPDEKMQEYKKWETDFDALSEKIKTLEAAEAKLAERAEPLNKPPFETPRTIEESQEERDRKQLRDFTNLIRYGWEDLPEAAAAEIRANQFYKGTTTAGGYMVPTLMGDVIADAKKYVGGMVDERVARWIKTSQAATLTFPKVDDTSVKGYVIAEKTDFATSASDMTFGQASLAFYKITSGLVKVSNELLRDAAFDVGSWIGEMLFKRLYRGLNYYFTVGTGTAQPYGIKAIATEGEAAAKRAITQTDLLNLAYSVNRAYQNNGMFQFNNTTMAAIRVLYLAQADSYHLWQPAKAMGEFDTLEGFPYIINDDIQGIRPIYRSVYFGDFKNFYIGECTPLLIRRLDELFAGTDEVGFVVFGSWAANLVAADYPIKNIRHATT